MAVTGRTWPNVTVSVIARRRNLAAASPFRIRLPVHGTSCATRLRVKLTPSEPEPRQTAGVSTEPPHEHVPVWSDEEWEDWTDYADQVRVEVRFKSWLGAEDEPEYWVLEADGAAWPKDWLTRQVVELASASAEASCCGRGNYALDIYDRKTEWGASSAAIDLILTLSQDLMSEATWLALYEVGRRAAARLRAKHPDWSGPPVTEEQAAESALWAVLRRYKESKREGLDVRSVEFVDDRKVLVVLSEAETGIRYTVEVTGHSESLRLSRVRKVEKPEREV